MRITDANYKKDKLYPRVVKAVTEILDSGNNEITSVEVLRRMDYLRKEHEERWRNGQVPYLERVLGANLSKLNRLLRILHIHALACKMKPFDRVHKRKGKRNGKITLRFSKSGDPNLEKAYQRCYWLPPESRKAKNKDSEEI